MGAGQSGGVEIGGSPMGYQVLRVYPDSPGSKAGLKAYFDFIIAIGNTRFNKEDGSLREILKASVDQKIKMIVFNTRTKAVREVDIVPTTSWGGSGLLGVSIKHSSFDRADERVWHVTQVDPGSPAQQAGFKAMNDYVVGSDSILQENDDLYNLIEAHEGKALKLFVYNVETDNCREIICHPNSKWGGRGFLGCEFGHGLLHRIPFGDEVATGGDSKKLTGQQPALMHQQPNNGSLIAPQQQHHQQPQTNLLQQQAAHLSRASTQPGQQLFQQALFNNQSLSPESSDPAKSIENAPLPQAPQTFAQLASAQFQAQQYQQQTAQIQQQQQLLEQQRQQLEEQQRQMEQLAAARKQLDAKPADIPSSVPNSNQTSERSPQLEAYQQGPPMPPSSTSTTTSSPPPPPPPLSATATQQPHQQPSPPLQQLNQQQYPPSAPQMSSPLTASLPHGVNQTISQPAPFQHKQHQFISQGHPQQPPSYQQYPYGTVQPTHLPEQTMMTSPYDGMNEPNPPPSVQTLPPPPTMYPPPPQAPCTQQQQAFTQCPPPPPPSAPLQQQQQQSMFENQM